MVRWVFRPFSNVWKAICTSALLRASTRVSPGFTLHCQSSPSFGSVKSNSCLVSRPSTKGKLKILAIWVEINSFITSNPNSPIPIFFQFLLLSSFFSFRQQYHQKLPSKEFSRRFPNFFFCSSPPPSTWFHSSRFLFVLKVSLPCRLAPFDNSLARVTRRVRISRFLLRLFDFQIFSFQPDHSKAQFFLQVFSFRKRQFADSFSSRHQIVLLQTTSVLAPFLRICIQNQTHKNLSRPSPFQKVTPSKDARAINFVSFLILTLLFATFTFHLA